MNIAPTKMSSAPLPSRKSNRRSSPKLLLLAFPAILLGGGAGVGIALSRQDPALTPNGLKLAGQNVGGQTSEEAKKKLLALVDLWKKTPIRLSFAPETGLKRVYTPPAGKLGLSVDVPATLKAISESGQEQGTLTRLAGLFGRGQVSTAAPVPTVDLPRLHAYLKGQVAKDINHRARNATIVPGAKGGYSIRKEKTGLKVDEEASANAIAAAWKTQLVKLAQSETPPVEAAPAPSSPDVPPADLPKPLKAPEAVEVTLALVTVVPKVTEADLKDLQEISSFTTRFGGTGASRGSNIALAAGKINGTVLAPGDVFSYNRIVGPRNERAGFRDAPVIVKGELVPGIGGGICQVSSTLYNAVLRSDLKIVSRSHHAFPVHYLPAGCDATVVDGAIDFKFQNNTRKPIYIASSSGGGRLSFRLLGEKTPGRSITIERTNVSTIPHDSTTVRDPDLYVGRSHVKDNGHNGHRVTVYRVIKENGQVVKRELVSRDYYRPFPSVILVGSRPRPVRITPKPKASSLPAAAPAVQPIAPAPSGTP